MDWHNLSMVVSPIGVFVLVSLYAIFCARLRFSTLPKMVLVALGIVPLLFINGPDLVLALLITGWVVLWETSWLKWMASGQESNRQQTQSTSQVQQNTPSPTTSKNFQLKDALFAFMPLAILLAIISRFDSLTLLGAVQMVCLGAAIGTSAMVIPLLWHSRKRIWIALVTLLILGGCWFGFVYGNEKLFETVQLFSFFFGRDAGNFFFWKSPDISFWGWFGWISVLVATIGVLVSTFCWAIGFNRLGDSRVIQLKNRNSEPVKTKSHPLGHWHQWLSRGLILMAGLPIVASVAYSYHSLLPPKKFEPSISFDNSKPNGLIALRSAGQNLDSLNAWPPIPLGPELKTQITAETEWFELVDKALADGNFSSMDWATFESLCPPPNQQGQTDFPTIATVELRAAARALNLRALQSLSDQHFDDAIADAIRGLKLADALNRDPLLITSLISTAIEGIFYETAFSTLEKVSVEKLTILADQLDFMMTRSPNANLESENIQTAENWMMWNKGDLLARQWINSSSTGSAFEDIFESLKRRNAYRRLLRVEIAIELFMRKHERRPTSLAELVPDLLNEVPLDPFNELQSGERRAELSYQTNQTATGYVLYSFSSNRIDDKGVSPEIDPYHTGDLNLRASTGNLVAEHNESSEQYLQSEIEYEDLEPDWLDEEDWENLEDGNSDSEASKTEEFEK